GLVVNDRMAVEEGTAAGVLTDQAQLVVFAQQGGVGKVLGEAPVHRDLVGQHLLPVFVDLRYAAVWRDAVGQRVDLLRQFDQRFLLHPRVGGRVEASAEVRMPVNREFIHHARDEFDYTFAAVHLVAIGVHHRLGLLGADQA